MLTAGARPALRRRRGVPAAARDRELPAAPGAALRRRVEHRDRAPGLQRHRPELRQRAPDRADEHHRRALQLQPARVLPDRGRDARGAAGRLRAGARSAGRRPPTRPRRRHPRRPPRRPSAPGAPRGAGGRRDRPAPPGGRARLLPPERERRRQGRDRRVAPRRRADHDRAAPTTAPTATSRCARASRSTGSRSARTATQLHARREHEARLDRHAGHLQLRRSSEEGADRLALQRRGRAAHVHGRVPVPRADRRLRRRRRREPARLGRRTGRSPLAS